MLRLRKKRMRACDNNIYCDYIDTGLFVSSSNVLLTASNNISNGAMCTENSGVSKNACAKKSMSEEKHAKANRDFFLRHALHAAYRLEKSSAIKKKNPTNPISTRLSKKRL